MAFAKDLVKVDHEGETMSKVGWVDLKHDTPSENFLDIYIGSVKKVTQYLGNLREK